MVDYGSFEIPDNAKLEVVVDPVKEALAQYQVWSRGIDDTLWWKDQRAAYNTIGATPIVTRKQLKKILPLLTGVRQEVSRDMKEEMLRGLYASALFNNSNIDTFVITTPLYLFGFKLRKGATLVNEATVLRFGTYAEGNTVNNGRSDVQASHANGGVHINNTTVLRLGYGACHSVTINNEHATTQAEHTRHGLHINNNSSPNIDPEEHTTIIDKITIIKYARHLRNLTPQEQQVLKELKEHTKSPQDAQSYIANAQKYLAEIRTW